MALRVENGEINGMDSEDEEENEQDFQITLRRLKRVAPWVFEEGDDDE